MGEFSLTHILLVAVIFLIFFGPSRLPQLGQSLGKAIRGFKDGLNEIETQAKDISDDRPAQRTQAEQTASGAATPDPVVRAQAEAKKTEHQS
jgi:sec-independent protein translocase protein TatA